MRETAVVARLLGSEMASISGGASRREAAYDMSMNRSATAAGPMTMTVS